MYVKIAENRYASGTEVEIDTDRLPDTTVAFLQASALAHIARGVELALAQLVKDERRRAMIAEAGDAAKALSALGVVADDLDEPPSDTEEDGDPGHAEAIASIKAEGGF